MTAHSPGLVHAKSITLTHKSYQVRRVSGHVFVLGLLILPVPSQESERSCICVLGLLILPVPSQESERSCMCVRVIDFACTKPGE
jgi:hypothetical protein